LAKASSAATLPDISKIGAGDKKVKVEASGVVGFKGDDFGFKEGNTAVMALKDIFVQEKGAAALKKISEAEAHGGAKVKGGAKNKKKAAAKKGGKSHARSESAGVRAEVGKIMKFTPSKSHGKKEGTPQKGKASTKRSVSKKTPSMPSPSGNKSVKTNDQMTIA